MAKGVEISHLFDSNDQILAYAAASTNRPMLVNHLIQRTNYFFVYYFLFSAYFLLIIFYIDVLDLL